MDNYIKVLSEEGVFDIGAGASRKRCSFIVEGNQGVLDLSKSYFSVHINNNTTLTNKDDAILNEMLLFDGSTANSVEKSSAYPNNVVIVKNASAYSQLRGRLEDLRNIGRLKGSLALYDMSDAKQTEDIDKMNTRNTETQYKPQPLNDLETIGSTESRKLTHELRVPLKDVFNFCNTENYDSDKYGTTKFTFELLLEKFSPSIDTAESFATRTLFNQGVGSEFDAFENQTVATTTSNFLITSNEYVSLKDSPFFVGQAMSISTNKDGAGQGAVAGVKKITSIEKDTDNNTDRLKITFDADWATSNGVYTENIVTIETARSNQTLEVEKIEMTIVQNNSPDMPKMTDKLVYSTYIEQADSYPASTSTNLNYDIPPMTKNVYITFGTNAVSEDANLNSYRLAVDNEEVVNRSVVVGSTLDYELKIKTFANNANSIKALESKLYDTLRSKAGGGLEQRLTEIKMIMFPVPFKQVPQRLNIELEASGGNLAGSLSVFMEKVMSV